MRGTVLYYHNETIGNKPDVGAKVFLVPGELPDVTGDDAKWERATQSPYRETIVDGAGNYQISGIPAGTYTILIKSANATQQYVEKSFQKMVSLSPGETKDASKNFGVSTVTRDTPRSASTPRDNPYTVGPPRCSFTVRFPSSMPVPKFEEDAGKNSEGYAYTLKGFMSSDDERAYWTQEFQYNTKVDTSRQSLRSRLDRFMAAFNGRLGEDKMIDVDGHQALTVRFSARRRNLVMFGQATVIPVNNKLYAMTCLCADSRDLDGIDTSLFFSSFRIAK